MDENLGSKLDDTLRQTSAYSEVKAVLQSHAASASLQHGVSERAALEQLLAKFSVAAASDGPAVPVPATLAAPVTQPDRPNTVQASSSSAVGPGMQLHVTLKGGQAFEGGLVGVGTGGEYRWALRVSLCFRGQRASTEAIEVAPGDSNPPLKGAFAFDVLRLPPAHSGSMASSSSLMPTAATALSAQDPLLTLCVTREAVPSDTWTHERGPPLASAAGAASSLVHAGLTRELLAMGDVDWRQVCGRGATSSNGSGTSPTSSLQVAVPLRAVGAEQEMSGSRGNLLVRLDLLSASANITNATTSTTAAATAAATSVSAVDPAAALVRELSSPGAGSAAPTTATQEAKEASENQRALFVYTRGWWLEYVREQQQQQRANALESNAAAAAVSTAPVRSARLFASCESDGQRRLVCSFLTPLRSGRLLPSPRHAARFVALLPLAAPNSSPASGGALGGGEGSGQNGAPWPTHFTTVCRRSATAEGRASLLCSLLLGFGLNAHVALGTRYVASSTSPGRSVEIEHAWVITVGSSTATANPATTGKNSAASPRVCGWDPTTGHTDGYSAFYHKLQIASCHTIFGSNCLYAAIRSDASPLALGDLRQWKRLPPLPPSPSHATTDAASLTLSSVEAAADLIGRKLPRLNRNFALLYQGVGGGDSSSSSSSGGSLLQGGSGLNNPVHQLEEVLESYLRSRIADWRDLNLQPRRLTSWDESLESLLDPALTAYETERCLGIPDWGNADFQESVRLAVPDGWAFKGYPACFGHADPKEIWRALIGPYSATAGTGAAPAGAGGNSGAASVVADLLATVGGGSSSGVLGEAAFAVRVRVYPYPEGAMATWVMLAVKAPA